MGYFKYWKVMERIMANNGFIVTRTGFSATLQSQPVKLGAEKEK